MDDITEEVRAETMQRLATTQAELTRELVLIDLLDQHRVIQVGNLGYYRSDVHCSCAAEWWTGWHDGDPSSEAMWDIHRAEVVHAFLTESKES